jgi:hypothetical protein
VGNSIRFFGGKILLSDVIELNRKKAGDRGQDDIGTIHKIFKNRVISAT